MTPPTITSPANPALKELRLLLDRRDRREREGRFVVEGEDLVEAAARAGWTPLAGYRAAGSGLGDPGFQDVEPALLDRLSRRGSGTRVLAVFRERRLAAPLGPLCVYLHGVRDPGNVGSVLRSAHALGASCVALGPGCADPFGPRATAASMGAIFAVPVARVPAPVDETTELPGTLVALAAGEGEELWTVHGPPSGPPSGEPHGGRAEQTLLVGAEREGLPREVLARADRVLHIPLAAGDSLNAAVAAAIGLYELSRPSAPVGPTQTGERGPAAGTPSRMAGR